MDAGRTNDAEQTNTGSEGDHRQHPGTSFRCPPLQGWVGQHRTLYGQAELLTAPPACQQHTSPGSTAARRHPSTPHTHQCTPVHRPQCTHQFTPVRSPLAWRVHAAAAAPPRARCRWPESGPALPPGSCPRALQRGNRKQCAGVASGQKSGCIRNKVAAHLLLALAHVRCRSWHGGRTQFAAAGRSVQQRLRLCCSAKQASRASTRARLQPPGLLTQLARQHALQQAPRARQMQWRFTHPTPWASCRGRRFRCPPAAAAPRPPGGRQGGSEDIWQESAPLHAAGAEAGGKVGAHQLCGSSSGSGGSAGRRAASKQAVDTRSRAAAGQHAPARLRIHTDRSMAAQGARMGSRAAALRTPLLPPASPHTRPGLAQSFISSIPNNPYFSPLTRQPGW